MTLLSAEFIIFLKGLLKLYLHVNQDTVDFFIGTGLAQQCNKWNQIVQV